VSWERKPLEAVADFCLGKMLDQKKNRGDLLPYLANVNVRWGHFDLEDLREMRFEHRELERYGLKYGDIVMCEGGEPGRCAIWKEQLPGMMFQKALHRIRPRKCLNIEFLFYSFLNKGRTGHFAPLFTGATIKHLPREKLAKVEVEVPPFPIQERIASILSAYDDLIENNRRRIQLLEQAARLLYKEWFVHLRFPGHEHVAITDGVPEGWEQLSLSEICSEKNGIQTGPFGSQLHQSDYTVDGVPVVMPQDLKDLRISTEKVARIPESLAEKLSRHRLRSGDIVYGRRGDIGRRALIRERQIGFFCGTGCLRLRPNTSISDPGFLYQALGERRVQEDIRNRAKGSTMPNLSAKSMVPVAVLLPPKHLQHEFSLHAKDAMEQIETLEEITERTARARDLLLPRLMNGEIAV